MRFFIRSWSPFIFHWSFCIQHQRIFFHLWCMLRGGVWLWMKRNLFQFMEGQIQFSTSWHAKMSLIYNKPKKNVLHCKCHAASKHALKFTKYGRCCMQTPNSRPQLMLSKRITLMFYWYASWQVAQHMVYRSFQNVKQDLHVVMQKEPTTFQAFSICDYHQSSRVIIQDIGLLHINSLCQIYLSSH